MLLRAVAPDCPRVLDLSGAGPVSGEALLRWSRSGPVDAWRRRHAGERVGLLCRDNGVLALALLALDGVAEAVVLLPHDASPEVVAGLAAKAGVTCRVSDRPDLAEWAEPLPGLAEGLAAGGCQGGGEPAERDTVWVLPTSGTTRTPKLVEHTLATLTKSVKRDRAKGAAVVWGLFYDLNRFAGLQVFLQAILGGSALVLPAPGAALPATLERFAAAGCTALSATPTLWRKILMSAEADRLRLRQVTLGGEIADATILAALANRFPGARIVHIYASTEAGVGFAVTDAREGFPATYLDSGVPGAALRVNAEGVLEIRPDRRGQRYLGESESLDSADGWVNTGDRVCVDAGRVYFLGRDSGAINVGGNKVQPEEVERVLLEHPAVAMVAVGAKRSGITGALVEARVVLRPGAADAAAIVPVLRAWCVERLERHKVPALLRVVDGLETGASGKISRH